MFFNTEIADLSRNWKALVADINSWPRLIQIAWILCDNKGSRIASVDINATEKCFWEMRNTGLI